MKKVIRFVVFLSLVYHVDSFCMFTRAVAMNTELMFRTLRKREKREKKLREIQNDQRAQAKSPTDEELDLLRKVRWYRFLTPQEEKRMALAKK